MIRVNSQAEASKACRLQIHPDDIGQPITIVSAFATNGRTFDYAARLYEAGIHHLDDLHGKTEAEIRKLVRTTDNNWLKIRWILTQVHGAKFVHEAAYQKKAAPAPNLNS